LEEERRTKSLEEKIEDFPREDSKKKRRKEKSDLHPQ